VQLTAASLDGRFGKTVERCARTLLDRRLAHLIASDAHAPDVRAVGLSAAVTALRDDDLARWLTHEVPLAIMSDGEVPVRPDPSRRKRWFK